MNLNLLHHIIDKLHQRFFRTKLKDHLEKKHRLRVTKS